MFQAFCEFPGGKDRICGAPILGRCIVCGRAFCGIHGSAKSGKMICWDCEGIPEKLEENQEKWAEIQAQEQVDELYLEPEESVDMGKKSHHINWDLDTPPGQGYA